VVPQIAALAPLPVPGAGGEPRLARLGPALAALATFALHAACWGRYGIFRDELYFLVCGERLAAGYVDQPPGIAVVARLASAVFGAWVPGLRLPAWLATAATVYLAGRLAARISGSGWAATLAAWAAFACLVLRGTAHILSMNAFEPLLVLAFAHVLLRVAQGGQPRLWVAAGGLAGLAVLFKYTAAPLLLALVLGLLATPARRTLRTPWALAGAAVGLLAVLPNLAWQAARGFPFLELVHNAVAYKNVPVTPVQFLGGLLLGANPGNAPLWLGGLLWLVLARGAGPARFLGVGGLLQLFLITLGHGKPYYAAPLLPLLLAGGGAAFTALFRAPAAALAYTAVLAASGLALAPMAVPILPEPALVAFQAVLGVRPTPMERLEQPVLPQVFADQHGWPELAAGVARVYRALPPEEQGRAAVYGANYGVASALEILGPAVGLPRGLAFSGHNSFWFWGLPHGRGDPLLLVGGPEEPPCRRWYREVALAAQLPRTPWVMPYEDAHAVWICRGARQPLTGIPPTARHFE
jgi:hypothetical protein